MLPVLFAHPLGWLLFALLVVAVVLAVWYTYQAAGALAAWAVGIGATVGLSAVLFVLMQYVSRSRWGRGLVLDREEGDEERPAAVQVTRNAPQGATQQEKHRQLVGKTGVAQTHLRPAGAALIDGQRVDVVAESERVDAGARVEVVAVQGNRVVVRRVSV